MNTTKLSILAIVLVLAISSAAEAMYSPVQGRWLQRDPAPPVLPPPAALSLASVVSSSATNGDYVVPEQEEQAAAIIHAATPGLGQDHNSSPRTSEPSAMDRALSPYDDGPNLYQYARSRPLNLTDPLGLSTKCGIRTCMCSSSGTRQVDVYGDSARARFILGLGFGKGAQGCVTLPNVFSRTGVQIFCTGGCKQAKQWKAGPGVPILDHECCHACDHFDKGSCKYVAGAVKDDCTNRARGGFETW